MKRCSNCKRELPVSQFHKALRERSGLRSACKECVSTLYNEQAKIRANDWCHQEALKNPNFYNDRSRMARHGLTPQAFADWDESHSTCDICGTLRKPDKALHIDHDHSCCPRNKSCSSCRRGALCDRCNMGLGYFCDDVDLLRTAVRYIETYKERNK
jgi:hypothetical protein